MVLGCENEARARVTLIRSRRDGVLLGALLGRDPNSYREEWKRCLPRVGFVHHEENAAFGFLNPMLVIRAVHLFLASLLARQSTFSRNNRFATLLKKETKTGICFT